MSVGADREQELLDFQRSVAAVGSRGLGAVALPATLFLLYTGDELVYFSGAAILLAVVAGGFRLFGTPAASILVLAIGVVAITSGYELFDDRIQLRGVGTTLNVLMIVLLSFVVRPALVAAFSGAVAGQVLIAAIDDFQDFGSSMSFMRVGVELGIVGMAALAGIAQGRRVETERRELEGNITAFENAARIADAIGRGNLTENVGAQTELGQSIRRMQHQLRRTVQGITSSISVVVPTTAEITVTAERNQQMASQQAAALTETRATVEELATTAREISGASRQVEFNSRSVVDKSDEVRRVFDRLTRLYVRIDTLLASIERVAQKSEILALNASLEGYRAGAAGTGFSLIAERMRQLAAESQSTAIDAKQLVRDIQAVSADADTHIGDMHRASSENADMASTIVGSVESHRQNTQAVLGGVAQLDAAGDDLASGATQTIESTRQLTALAIELEQMVDRFTV